MGNKNNKFLVQGSILAVASIISRFIGMLYRIPLNRIVGPDGMGTYGTAFEIYNLFLVLSSYSLPLAVSKLVSAREVRKEYKNSYRIFTTAMGISVTVGTLACTVLFFGAGIWAKINNNSDLVLPLRILAPTIIVFSVMGVLRGLFQGKNTMIPTAISQLIEQIINACVSIIAAYLLMKEHNASSQISMYGAAGGTSGTLTGAVFGMLFLSFIFSIYRPILKKRLRKDKSDVQETVKEAAKAILFTAFPVIISQTVFQVTGVIDNAMWGQIEASHGLTSNEYKSILGAYSQQYKVLTNLPVSIATALGTAIVPTLAAAFAANDMNSVRSKVATSLKFNMIIAFPSAVGMIALAKPIVSLLFGTSEYTNLSASMLKVGAIAVVFFALSTMTNGVLQGIDRMKLPVIHATISLVIHVLLLFLLLKVFNLGAFGLVLGNMSFALVICILNWISIGKLIEYRQEVLKTFVLPCVASVIMGVVTYFVYQLIYPVLHSNLLSVTASMAAAVIIYGPLIILLRTVDEEELLVMPKGGTILRICKKLHLM